ncbi:hypothetical protein MKW92_018162 [Papaver armeniacum]|nr:hypothetical protein MKW92_018162 [Papaver armeniacum]
MCPIYYHFKLAFLVWLQLLSFDVSKTLLLGGFFFLGDMERPDHFIGVYIIVQDDKDEFPANVAMLAAQDDATRCKVFVLVVYFGSLNDSYLNIGPN